MNITFILVRPKYAGNIGAAARAIKNMGFGKLVLVAPKRFRWIGLVLAIIGGIGVQGQNVAFLVALAFAVAASANLPTILYSLFWRGFTTRGAVWSMYGGLGSAIILIVASPVFWGTETSVFPVGTALWPLNNPGIVSIPLGIFLGWLGSVTSRKAENRRLAAEMDVRSLTGYGAEKATSH